MSKDVDQDLIDDLFARAVELPSDERQKFLSAAVNDDTGVLAQRTTNLQHYRL